MDLRKKSSCFISLCCITTEYWTVILKLLPHNFSYSWRESSHIDYNDVGDDGDDDDDADDDGDDDES